MNTRFEPSTDARFYVQFFRESDEAVVPGIVRVDTLDRSGPWTHRGRDLDTEVEILEMVTRQYVDVGQDDLLKLYFDFGPGFIDWQAHIRTVADYWCHVLLYAPGYEIDTIENHGRLHDSAPFTPKMFDRWLQIFEDSVRGQCQRGLVRADGHDSEEAGHRYGMGNGAAVPRPRRVAPGRSALTSACWDARTGPERAGGQGPDGHCGSVIGRYRMGV